MVRARPVETGGGRQRCGTDFGHNSNHDLAMAARGKCKGIVARDKKSRASVVDRLLGMAAAVSGDLDF